MKVALNLKPLEGPFGGGNSFVETLARGLRDNGFEVYFDLNQEDIDFILLLDPRWRHPLVQFNTKDIVSYLSRNDRTLVIHRINECDERKNTNFMNRKLRLANYLADSTVFVSDWLTTLNLTHPRNSKESFTVIRNGSNKDIFFPDKSNTWNGRDKLRLVTHHWSSNSMKGADLYNKLDSLIGTPKFAGRIEFTYIGNTAREMTLVNTTVIPPLFGKSLAEELRRHHVYITGSINEPGGNHQNEGGLSGLPIIFIDSGSMKEYCEGFGLELKNSMDLESALEEILIAYQDLREKMSVFPNDAETMLAQYQKLMRHLDENRSSLLEKRKRKRDRGALFRLQFPI